MATVTKKDKFFDVLKNIFIGAKIEGESGYVNLMRIKSKYYHEFKDQLLADIDAKLNDVGKSFEEELYNKLYTFFKKYFSESGSIYFSYTPLQEKVYERIYRDDKDVMLFWKTHMLYYVKTERLYKNLEIQDEETNIFYLFDVSKLEHKKNNERKDLVFDFANAEFKDNKRQITLTVEYSKNGKKTKIDEILKQIKKASRVFNSLTEKQVERACGIFRKQSEVDYFINKNAKEFLREQFSLWIKGYVMDDETLFEADRLKQLKALQSVAFNIIDLVSQFEDELVKIWNKPKFAHSSNYVITLDKIAEKSFTLIETIIKHKGFKSQLKEWQELGIIDENFKKEDIINSKKLSEKWQFLPLDTKYFKEIEIELLALFDDLDNQLDGWLIHSENFQALNTIKEKYRKKIQTIYIDPPFNLEGSDKFDYRTNYKDSSWLTMLQDRLIIAKKLINTNSELFVRIDYHGNHITRSLVDNLLGEDNFKNEILVQKGRNTAGSAGKLDVTYDSLFLYTFNEKNLKKVKVKRSIANIKWTGFLMAGERRPPEREFLGKTLFPPKGQHWSLVQPKVTKLLDEKYLRLKCKDCSAYYYKAKDRSELDNFMKRKNERFKFYDIYEDTDYYGVENISTCLNCGADNFKVEYLGASEMFLGDNWLDVSGYANSTGFQTENAEVLLKRVIELSSEPNDYVIDFYAGSATTQAVAHKMQRKWIGIDMGEHFNTIEIPRLKLVLSGKKLGSSKEIIDYNGGGFFKYYSMENYEETLKACLYEDKKALPNHDIFHQYIFLKDLKLAGEVLKLDDESNQIKVDLTKLHEQIDIPETLSHLKGKFIKQIQKDKVIFTDGSEIDLNNIDYKIVKPLIWW